MATARPTLKSPTRGNAFGLPARRNLGSSRGQASAKDTVADAHRLAAYTPKPLPQNTR